MLEDELVSSVQYCALNFPIKNLNFEVYMGMSEAQKFYGRGFSLPYPSKISQEV